jgi:histidine phosphotransferase ChpT
MSLFSLEPLDLAALLCSRVCHDVISPVGAIVNGLEVLEEETDQEMRDIALDLIRKSAKTASAKLQFCRLAFGAAGSAGASIDTGDAESVARNLFEDEKTKLEWNCTRVLMGKNKVKLVLNLCLIAAASIPRGGVIRVSITDPDGATQITLETSGTYLRLAQNVAPLVAGTPEEGRVDAHGIQPFYTGLVARECNMDVAIDARADIVRIEAVTRMAQAAE